MATILDLLMALNRDDLPNLPAPARPLPLGPLRPPNVPTPYFEAEPELPPAAPLPALDRSIIDQYLQAQGPAPTAPAPRSRGERIANALAGFGAGFRGQGGEFLAQLDEPRRRYEALLADYNNRRSQLALAGTEAATRKQERQQEQATRRAMAQADREFELYKQRSGITDKLALQQLDQAHEMAKLREAERIADERLERQQNAAREKQRNDIVSKLISQDFAPQRFANEIADAIVFGKPLSAAVEKWRSVKARKLEAQLANIGGGSGGGPVMAKLQNGQLVPLDAVSKDLGGVMLNGELVPVVEYVGGRIPGKPQQQAAPTLNFPEFGGGLLPGAGAGTAPTEQDVRKYAKRFKMSREQARKELTGQ